MFWYLTVSVSNFGKVYDIQPSPDIQGIFNAGQRLYENDIKEKPFFDEVLPQLGANGWELKFQAECHAVLGRYIFMKKID